MVGSCSTELGGSGPTQDMASPTSRGDPWAGVRPVDSSALPPELLLELSDSSALPPELLLELSTAPGMSAVGGSN